MVLDLIRVNNKKIFFCQQMLFCWQFLCYLFIEFIDLLDVGAGIQQLYMRMDRG